MSYAAVAAENAPPLSQQPHPDPALLTTASPSSHPAADDANKVNVVSHDFKTLPTTVTSTSSVPFEPIPIPISGGIPAHTEPLESPEERSKGHRAAGAAKKYAHNVEEEGYHLWNVAKHHLLRPGVAGGLIGVVNLGLLSFASYSLYSKPYLRRDTKFLASAAAAAFTLLSAEGYAAEQYRKTPAGQKEERRAKEEGATLYRIAKENILRPGVLGGLLGVLNTAIIGTVGFYGYKHWESPRWDRRIVSTISISLLALWSGEGYLAEQYRNTHR